MKRLFCVMLLVLVAVSCSYELELKAPMSFKPKVVLNSFISPDHQVEIDFGWSRSTTDDKYDRVAPPNGSVVLKEDDKTVATAQIVVSDEENIFSRASFDYLPCEGHTYRVEATIASYGEVSAETYIPKRSEVKAEVVEQVKAQTTTSYNRTCGVKFNVSDIAVSDDLRSLWFYSYGVAIDSDTQKDDVRCSEYRILFCSNPYIDNVNRAEEVDLTGESLYYLDYRTGDPMYYNNLRLPLCDIARCSSFEIASEYSYGYGSGNEYDTAEQSSTLLTHVRLVTISPSDDFDRYQKSAYQQFDGIYYFDMTPISFEEVRVYTNITNGLGVFAGYSQTAVDMPVKNFKEEE